MEVSNLSSELAVFGRMVMESVVEAVFAETLLAAQRSVASLLIVVYNYSLFNLKLFIFL